jgi:ketosteroid isomerase-like protein
MKKIIISILMIFCFTLYIPSVSANSISVSKQTNTEQKNIELIKSMMNNMYDVWASSSGSNGLFDKIFAKNFVYIGNGTTEHYEHFKKHFIANYKNWKSVKIKIYDIFAHGNKVVLRAFIVGVTNNGAKYELDFIDIFKIENGKIVIWWEESYPDWREIIKKQGEKY